MLRPSFTTKLQLQVFASKKIKIEKNAFIFIKINEKKSSVYIPSSYTQKKKQWGVRVWPIFSRRHRLLCMNQQWYKSVLRILQMRAPQQQCTTHIEWDKQMNGTYKCHLIKILLKCRCISMSGWKPKPTKQQLKQ